MPSNQYNMQSISLSIIVPAHNIQEFIAECLESILSQLKCNHELIVVNDGSTDDTLLIITKLQIDYGKNNFHIINQHNQGPSDARNNAIEIAKGDYIVLVDGDDVLLPNSLNLIDETIQKYHPDVIACDYRVWFPNKKIDTKLSYQSGELITNRDIILATFFVDRNMSVWSKVFKTGIYRQLGRIFPSGQLFEDTTAAPQLLGCCQSLFYLPHILIDYRQRSNSITKTFSEKHCLDNLSALTPVKAYLNEQHVSQNVTLYFDILVCVIYLGVVKNSYQFSGKLGEEVRLKLKTIFLESLCNDCEKLLSTMEKDKTLTDYALNTKTANRIRLILANNKLFHYKRIFTSKRQQAKKIYIKIKQYFSDPSSF